MSCHIKVILLPLQLIAVYEYRPVDRLRVVAVGITQVTYRQVQVAALNDGGILIDGENYLGVGCGVVITYIGLNLLVAQSGSLGRITDLTVGCELSLELASCKIFCIALGYDLIAAVQTLGLERIVG
ncbi:MAG: hypothetical protein IKM90_01085 [Bacteroidaceae bacterium]|nr:hypothetical protein [Bacteroidaceae bacterium]